jgi:hypothetical protein
MDWIDWHRLERSLPLDDLPRFHRAFLTMRQPETDWQAASLRQVQGKVQAALKRLEREGHAKREGELLLVDRKVIPEGFEDYLATDYPV